MRQCMKQREVERILSGMLVDSDAQVRIFGFRKRTLCTKAGPTRLKFDDFVICSLLLIVLIPVRLCDSCIAYQFMQSKRKSILTRNVLNLKMPDS